jgi:hypothetical protein
MLHRDRDAVIGLKSAECAMELRRREVQSDVLASGMTGCLDSHPPHEAVHQSAWRGWLTAASNISTVFSPYGHSNSKESFGRVSP